MCWSQSHCDHIIVIIICLYIYVFFLSSINDQYTAKLSHFSRVQLCATPQTAAHQASPSLGFYRQEHWSGLPFPSPMHESEKWKWSSSVVSDSLLPHGLWPARLLHPWDSPGKSTGVGCHRLLQLYSRENYIQYPEINHNRKEYLKSINVYNWITLWYSRS